MNIPAMCGVAMGFFKRKPSIRSSARCYSMSVIFNLNESELNSLRNDRMEMVRNGTATGDNVTEIFWIDECLKRIKDLK